jgi:hypothetical protein
MMICFELPCSPDLDSNLIELDTPVRKAGHKPLNKLIPASDLVKDETWPGDSVEAIETDMTGEPTAECC